MKSNEIRLGNLLMELTSNDIFEVKESYYQLLQVNLNCSRPIPLTEEWLLKFGYDLTTENHYALSGHLIWKCNDLFMCDKNGIVLKYVHQLQNLYFALTGEELTKKI